PPEFTSVFDAQTGELKYQWRLSWSTEPFFTPDSRHVAVFTSQDEESQTLHLAKLETGEVVWSHPVDRSLRILARRFNYAPDFAPAAAFTQNSEKMVIVGVNKTIQIRAADSGGTLWRNFPFPWIKVIRSTLLCLQQMTSSS